MTLYVPRGILVAWGALVALSASACTVVRIETASRDDVELSARFGIVNLELKPGARSVLVESTSLGAINGLEGLSVGYRSAAYVAFGQEDCRVVVWIHSDAELKELNQLLRDHTDVCVRPAASLKRGNP